MSLTPYGAHNPAPEIDLALYPFRELLWAGNADAATAIFWFDTDPLPFDVEVVELLHNSLTTGGGVLLMARTAEVLERTRAAVLMIADSAGAWA